MSRATGLSGGGKKGRKRASREGPVCLPCDTSLDHPRYKMPTPPGVKLPCQLCGDLTWWVWTAKKHRPNVLDLTGRRRK